MTFDDFSDIEFSDNADPRAPLSLILDVSSSMDEPRPGENITPLESLNNGLDVLVTELHKDPLAKRRVEVSVVTYGSHVTPATPFTTVDSLILPTLVPSGTTSTGAAIEESLRSLEERKQTYRANGIQYFRPWVILMTDGLATDDVTQATQAVADGEKNKAFSFFAVGVSGADMPSLHALSSRPAMALSGLKFSEFFQWLSASQAAVSSSNPGDGGVKLPAPTGWAEIDV